MLNMRSLLPDELPEYLYRGVRLSTHVAGNGLTPKVPGKPFVHGFSRGEGLGRTRGGAGSGATRTPSTKNAVIAHEFEVRDSGISTSTSPKAVLKYALSLNDPAGESQGVVYRISTDRLAALNIAAYVVAAIVFKPRVLEDLEVILVAADFRALAPSIIERIDEHSR
jgi:hypothetical protein